MRSAVVPEFISPLRDYGIELHRLRRLRDKKRLLDTTKLAHLWLKLRSRNYRNEWLRARVHWFYGGTSLDDMVEKNLVRFIEREETYRDKYINFDDDLHMFKVDLATSGAGACVAAGDVA